jgi:hypothetical protein
MTKKSPSDFVNFTVSLYTTVVMDTTIKNGRSYSHTHTNESMNLHLLIFNRVLSILSTNKTIVTQSSSKLTFF